MSLCADFIICDMVNLLKSITKPIRYAGNEYNQILKDPSQVIIRIALCFPDLYEIGMSHLGWKILYHIINQKPDAYAERVFAPWDDMETALKSHSIPLSSLETATPLYAFDLIGLSLLYELCYTNILTVLKSGGIPIWREERKEFHPLIIAGGPCAFNPEPLSDIIDGFAIGDGEEIINDIIEKMIELKKGKATRKDKIKELAKIPGFYAPDLFEKKLALDSGLIYRQPKKNATCPVQKRLVNNIDHADHPVNIIVPNTEVTHDRISIEIMRGCERGCRFCHAGMVYRPVRERSPHAVMDFTLRSMHQTGYDEVTFASLSSGDYSYLSQILPKITDLMHTTQTAISLPSLFPKTLTEELILEILKIRKTGITIAPEAATERLRNIINKPISNDEIMQSAEIAFKNGWQQIKLYFMIGLPFEREEDIREIAALSHMISKLGKDIDRNAGNLNITISSFVPKAHTPFQFAAMNTEEELFAKQSMLKRLVHSNKRINLKFQNTKMSWLEGIFSRGDARLNTILVNAWKEGCRFDGWDEKFNHSLWSAIFEKAQMNPGIYLGHIPEDSTLPWDHISSLVSKDYLCEEWLNARKGKLTPPAGIHACNQCSVCSPELLKELIHLSASHDLNNHITQISPSATLSQSNNSFSQESDRKSMPEQRKKAESPDIHIKKAKLRISFSKTSAAVFLSHLDLYRNIRIIMKRTNIPISYSEGFHPLPRISMGPALPTGIASKEDFFDITLYDFLNPTEVLPRLNNASITGLNFIQVATMPLISPSLNSLLTHSLYSFKIDDEVFKEYFFTAIHDNLFIGHSQKWQWFFHKEPFLVQKKNSEKQVNLLNAVEFIKINEINSTFHVMLKMNNEAHVNIIALMNAVYPDLELPDSLTHEYYLIESKNKKLGIFDYAHASINVFKKYY